MNTCKNNLIVLCEGTDTEYNYFINAKEYVERNYPDRFAKIKVVPTHSEIIQTKNPKRKETRSLKVTTDLPHYGCLEEHSVEEYERYKQQPTRYVRETQLYLEDEGFMEVGQSLIKMCIQIMPMLLRWQQRFPACILPFRLIVLRNGY